MKKKQEIFPKSIHKPTGLIVVAYPGMGQQVLTKEIPFFAQFNSERYIATFDDDQMGIKPYVDTAIDYVTDAGANSVMFLDHHPKVIQYLIDIDQDFIIYYPTVKKNIMIERLATLYLDMKVFRTASQLVDAVLNYDMTIAELRQYPNSIESKDGFIKFKFLSEVLKLSMEERYLFLRILKDMKKVDKTKSDDSIQDV